MGAENSRITNIDQLRQRIDGGAIRGNSLFHSFLEFNVGANGSVYFANPANIQNILSRVTGGNASHILGTLGVLGNANLFLINPNGIIFGENASLDINGSFHATTSNSIQWGEDGFFSAVEPGKSNLLSVNPNTLFLNHAANHQGSIINNGTLEVNAGEDITFFGNTVVNSGSLVAPGGTIQLLGDRIGLLNNALIDVSHTNNAGTVLIGGDFQGQGTLPNATYTYVGSEAIIKANSTLNGDGGKVIVWGNDSTRFYGKIEAKGGLLSGNGGFVEVSGKDFLDFRGQVNTSAPNGEMGTLLIDPTNIEVVEFFSPEAETFDLNDVDEFSDIDIGADGDTKIDVFAIDFSSSDVILQATNNITFNADIDTIFDVDLEAEAGNNIIVNRQIKLSSGGNINLDAGNDIILNQSIQLRTNVFDETGLTNNQGGKIELKVINGSLNITDSSLLSNTQSLGDAGNISLVGDIVTLNNSTVETDSLTNSGNAGNIAITGRLITLNNASRLQAFSAMEGQAGDIDINAEENVTINQNSSVQTEVFLPTTQGQGGNIKITVYSGDIELRNNSALRAGTRGSGNAGNVVIESRNLIIDDSGILTDVGNNANGGNAGDILITLEGTLTLTNDGQLRANTEGNGNGGSIVINAPNGVLLESDSQISVETSNEGKAGDITVTSDNITIGKDSQLSATATETSTNLEGGGNIRLNTSQLNIAGELGIFAETESKSSAGNLILQSNNSQPNFNLRFTDNGLISAKTVDVGEGGNIKISAPQTVDIRGDGQITVETTGRGNAGTIEVMGSVINLADGLEISASTLGDGDAGNINLNGNQIYLSNAQINAFTNSKGNPGSIIIENKGKNAEKVTLTNNSLISTEIQSQGQATQPSNININTQELNLNNNSEITASTAGKGDAGNIEIPNAQTINLNQSKITASTSGEGNTGVIKLQGNNQITLENNSIISSSVEENAQGDSQRITLDTPNLNLNNSRINARTSGLGNAGNIELNNNQNLNLDKSIISTEITATGEANQTSNININTQELNLNNNSEITASTAGQGDAGNIAINTETIDLDNNSKILTIVDEQARGNGGTINIKTSSNSVILNNNSEISSRSQGLGNAGNIFIDSSGVIRLIDSDISTSSQQASGGKITILGSIIRFRGDSDLRTNVNSGIGGGGDIFLQANSIILYDDSDIFAFAKDGQGGNIILNTPIFFGEGYQMITNRQNTDSLDNNNQVNLDASGAIYGSIIVPDLTFIRNSLTELSTNIIDPDKLIANTCVIPNSQQSGTFIITGSNGLPEKPGNTSSSYYSTGSIQMLPNQDNSSLIDSQIVEPQGVFKLPDGRLILSRRCFEEE